MNKVLASGKTPGDLEMAKSATFKRMGGEEELPRPERSSRGDGERSDGHGRGCGQQGQALHAQRTDHGKAEMTVDWSSQEVSLQGSRFSGFQKGDAWSGADGWGGVPAGQRGTLYQRPDWKGEEWRNR